jgi:hypothetical protein
MKRVLQNTGVAVAVPALVAIALLSGCAGLVEEAGDSAPAFSAKPRLGTLPRGCGIQVQSQIDVAEARYQAYLAAGAAGATAAQLSQLYSQYQFQYNFAQQQIANFGC